MPDGILELENEIEVQKRIIANLEARIEHVEENLKAKFAIQGGNATVSADEWDKNKYNDYLRLDELKNELSAQHDELDDLEIRLDMIRE